MTYYFDLPYFRLNRTLLMIIGQWPYQKYSNRVTMWILYIMVVLSGIFVEYRRALLQEEFQRDFLIEMITLILASTYLTFRYFLFTVYSDNVKRLLSEMNEHWQSLTNVNDQKIFCAHIEESTYYVGCYAQFMIVMMVLFSACTIASPLLIHTPYFNQTCPLLLVFGDNVVFDPQKYCMLILVHLVVAVVTLMLGSIATDTMYMTILYHCVSLFQVACYRLEHAFDNYSDEKEYAFARVSVCQRIADAVEMHTTAIRFADRISKLFSTANLVSLALSMVSIAITLFWAARSKQEIFRMLFPVVMVAGFLLHLFLMDLPSQRMLDSSEAIIFKAYCGMWYKAPPKEQILLLLTMRRGLNPTAMVMGKVHRASLENYAAEVKASFSYFTLLLSVQ